MENDRQLWTRLVLAVALVAAALSLTPALLERPPIPFAHLLAAAVAVALLHRLPLFTEASGWRGDLGFSALLLVLLAWGPANAAAVLVLETALAAAWQWRPGRRCHVPTRDALAFFTLRAWRAAAAGLAGLFLHGSFLPFGTRLSWTVLVSAALFIVIAAAGEAVAGSVSVGGSGRQAWLMMRRSFLGHFLLAGVVLSAALAIAFLPPAPFQAALALAPLWVIHHSCGLMAQASRRKIQRIRELNHLNNGVISVLATAIEAKDRYTNKHVHRVRIYALAISDHLGLPREQHEAIRCAALLHDIGKLVVPEHVLMKPGKLTPSEYRQVQQHVEAGVEILRPVPFPWPVLDVVRGHHERWDGLGYPRGLKGEDIPIGARVIAIADVFDALTVDRPYRTATTREQAAQHIAGLSGTHFDPAVVTALLAVLPRCAAQIAALGLDADERPARDAHLDLLSDAVVDQIAHANSEFLSLYDVSRALSGTRDLEQTLNAVADKIEQMVPFRTCAIFLHTGKTGEPELRLELVRGRYREFLLGMTVRSGEGLSGRVFQTLEPIINGPSMLDVGRKMPPDEEVSLNLALVVPLRAGGRTLGTISLYHSGLFTYNADHRRLLSLIAEHSASAIDTAQRLHRNEAMAHSDPLTGLPNARALTEWISERTTSARLSQEPFALIMADLDSFKVVNDTCGHLRGDEFLRQTGDVMSACLRPDDLLVRYAGDEFVVGVSLARADAVESLGSRLADAMDDLARREGLPVGLSVGAAIYPDDGLTARDLLHVADQRMYRNKARRKKDGSRQ